MQNFFYGLIAIGRGLAASFQHVSQFEIFWGFVAGFIISINAAHSMFLKQAFLFEDEDSNR